MSKHAGKLSFHFISINVGVVVAFGSTVVVVEIATFIRPADSPFFPRPPATCSYNGHTFANPGYWKSPFNCLGFAVSFSPRPLQRPWSFGASLRWNWKPLKRCHLKCRKIICYSINLKFKLKSSDITQIQIQYNVSFKVFVKLPRDPLICIFIIQFSELWPFSCKNASFHITYKCA